MKVRIIEVMSSGQQAAKRTITPAIRRLSQKAEERLQSRLTNLKTLMRNAITGDILEISTGKKFTGKFSIKSGKVEQIFDIREGRNVFTLIRDNNLKKVLIQSNRPGKSAHTKTFPIKSEISQDMDSLKKAYSDAFEQMNQTYHKIASSPENCVDIMDMRIAELQKSQRS